MYFARYLLFVLALVTGVGHGYAQSTRSALTTVNNSIFTNCGTGCITGNEVHSWNQQILSATGFLNDANVWTGANSFPGVGYLYANGSSPVTFTTPAQTLTLLGIGPIGGSYSSATGLGSAANYNVAASTGYPANTLAPISWSTIYGNGYRSNTQTQVNAIDPYPYDNIIDWRSYILAGQSSATSTSTANISAWTNWYNVSNGPGVTITCTATNGSNVLTACSPSPTATNPASGQNGQTSTANVYVSYSNGAAISSLTSGLAAGAQVESITSSTMSLYTGNAVPSNWTGTTGTVAFTVVSGRAELNNIGTYAQPIGTETGGGPAGGTNWYNDCIMGSPIGATQEGFLSCMEFIVTKTSQGNTLDRLHNGSQGISVSMLPNMAGNQTTGAVTYPVNDGVAIQGWSGPIDTYGPGGQASDATPGAINGLRVGGGCQNVYCNASMRSYFNYGIDIEDYAQAGIIIQNRRSGATGPAIQTNVGAGNIVVGESVYVSGLVASPYYQAGGTAISSTGGTCATGSYSGGASAGVFKLTSTCSSGTVIITPGIAASTGWSCFANDQGNASAKVYETAYTGTTVTFTVSGAGADYVNWSCTMF